MTRMAYQLGSIWQSNDADGCWTRTVIVEAFPVRVPSHPPGLRSLSTFACMNSCVLRSVIVQLEHCKFQRVLTSYATGFWDFSLLQHARRTHQSMTNLVHFS